MPWVGGRRRGGPREKRRIRSCVGSLPLVLAARFCGTLGAWRVGGFRAGRFIARPPPPKAEAAAARTDDGGAVGQAIEQCGRELFVAAEDLRPLAEGEIARDQDGAALVARGEEIEEEL